MIVIASKIQNGTVTIQWSFTNDLCLHNALASARSLQHYFSWAFLSSCAFFCILFPWLTSMTTNFPTPLNQNQTSFYQNQGAWRSPHHRLKIEHFAILQLLTTHSLPKKMSYQHPILHFHNVIEFSFSTQFQEWWIPMYFLYIYISFDLLGPLETKAITPPNLRTGHHLVASVLT